MQFESLPALAAPFPVPLLAAPVAPPRDAVLRWPVCILGVPLDPVTTDEALARIAAMVESREPHYVVTPNVDFLVRARTDAELHRILCEADLVLCDGQPLVWASRWFGNPLPERVAGADLAPRLIAQAAGQGHRIFLLGATPEANAQAAARLQAQHGTLQIAGCYAPPFRPPTEREQDELICRIRAAEPDILLVAFGCPKQEKWIARNYRALQVPVCIGVGATIDFLAGRVPRAPAWMRRAGLEWTYRLLQEPRRLFRRYATDLRCFGAALLGEWWDSRRPAVAAGTIRIEASTPALQQVRVTGALDRAALEEAGATCRKISEGDGDCRLDLADVGFLDNTGAGALALWHRQLRRRGRRLVLAGASRAVRRRLGQAGLIHFEITEAGEGRRRA